MFTEQRRDDETRKKGAMAHDMKIINVQQSLGN